MNDDTFGCLIMVIVGVAGILLGSLVLFTSNILFVVAAGMVLVGIMIAALIIMGRRR
jgi:hypothetical protein